MMKSVQAIILLGVLLIASSPIAQNHIVIGWNDLGMHCSNKDFSSFVVLPPFNNIHAQVVQVGDAINPPVVVTSNLRVSYEIPGNTYSVGKTNFWDYTFPLFGVNLPPNIGLAGAGLTGDMTIQENYFYVTGVPLTPFTDADLVNEDPFQLGLLKLYDQSNNLLASIQPVVPVSNEINCVRTGCHASAQAILDQHGPEAGFDPNGGPILCASCHSSNALGTPGHPGLPSLSQAVHEHHGGITNDCYKCHPVTQYAMSSGRDEHETRICLSDVSWECDECGRKYRQWPGTVVARTILRATACHGANYAEEPGKLFRQSRGHGGLFCSACHGEPHAIVTSRVARDNAENITLQGYAGTFKQVRGLPWSGAERSAAWNNCNSMLSECRGCQP